MSENQPGEYFEPHIPEFKDERAQLKFTQNLRLQIIQTKTRNGVEIQQLTDDDIDIVLRAANDIDRQSLASMKIAADDANADADRKASMMIASMYRQVTSNPFELQQPNEDQPLPSVDNSILDQIPIDEGTMSIGIVDESSESFFKKFEK